MWSWISKFYHLIGIVSMVIIPIVIMIAGSYLSELLTFLKEKEKHECEGTVWKLIRGEGGDVFNEKKVFDRKSSYLIEKVGTGEQRVINKNFVKDLLYGERPKFLKQVDAKYFSPLK